MSPFTLCIELLLFDRLSQTRHSSTTWHEPIIRRISLVLLPGSASFSQSIMSWHSDNRGYRPNTTIPTSHHNTHRAAHSTVPNQPQQHLVIKRLGPQRSPRDTHDLREQLNERRSNEVERMREIEDLQKENERLRREQDLKEMDAVASRIRPRRIRTTTTDVSWSREQGRHDRLQQKRHRYERSQEQTRHTHTKKNRSIDIGPFAKWIHNVALDLSLKIPQFVLYFRQSSPLEHICGYKSAISLVNYDEAILCKACPSTLLDKALT